MDNSNCGDDKQPMVNTPSSAVFVSKDELRTLLRQAGRAAVIGGSIRFSLRAALWLFSLLKKSGRKVDKEALLQIVRSSLRTALFCGSYVGTYKLFLFSLKRRFATATKGWNECLAGSVAALTLIIEEPGTRMLLGHYLLARAFQCIWNRKKAQGVLKINIPHGDAILFSLACAQIMYAYVVNPSILPESYYKFIRDTGPIPEVVLSNVRRFIQGKAIHVNDIQAYGAKYGQVISEKDCMKCLTLHPMQPNCFLNFVRVFFQTFSRVITVYLPVALIPSLVFYRQAWLKSPALRTLHVVKDTLQSSTFLSLFCSLYQFFVCFFHRVFRIPLSQQVLFALCGFACAFPSILVEKKRRRAELALYALPRAWESLYDLVCQHSPLSRVRYGEVLLFAAAMGIISKYHSYPNRKEIVHPMILSIFSTFRMAMDETQQ